MGELFTFKALVADLASIQPRPTLRAKAGASAQIPRRARNQYADRRLAAILHPTHLAIRCWPASASSLTTGTHVSQNRSSLAGRLGEFADDKSIDLLNVKTFMAAYEQDRGSVVLVTTSAKNTFAHLAGQSQQAVVTNGTYHRKRDRSSAVFAAFENAYMAAIREFPENGGGAPANLTPGCTICCSARQPS